MGRERKRRIGQISRGGEVPTLMKKALKKAAGSLSLYLLVTSTPPTTVAALLAKVNCNKYTNTHTSLYNKVNMWVP